MKVLGVLPIVTFLVGVVVTAMTYTFVLAAFFDVEWETILSAVLALIAATLTVYFLYLQQRQTDRLHQEEILRKFRASIAVAPLALSEICAYASSSLEFAVKADACLRANTEVDFDAPRVSETVIASLRQVIENSKDENVTNSFSLLVSEIQVHISRQRSLPRVRKRETLSGAQMIHSSHAFHHAIIDAVSLYVFASSFFSFVRGKSDETLPVSAPSTNEILTNLHRLDIDAYAFPEVYGLLGAADDDET